MARQFWLRIKFTALAALHLAAPVSAALASTVASAEEQAPTTSTQPPLGRFLTTLGGSHNAPRRVGHTEFSEALRHGEQSFVGWTYLEGRQVWRREPSIYEAFQAECRTQGGSGFGLGAQVGNEDHYTALRAFAFHAPSSIRVDFHYATCTDRSGAIMSAMITMSGASNLAVYILTPQAANAALFAHYQRQAEEEAFQARMRREREDLELYTAAWRRDLGIGTETNCGAVIQLRGPMIEVALSPRWRRSNGAATAWARREQLHPLPRHGTNDLLMACPVA